MPKKPLDDKTIMESMLNVTKGACNLYLNGTIESGTADVRSTFDCVLDDTLTMQNEIYTKMSDKGWYPATQAKQTQIKQTRDQFTETI